jgi:putative hydrolase of the HAD superfamily
MAFAIRRAYVGEVKPRAILFDLDDTILLAYANPEAAWLAVAVEMSELLWPVAPAEVAAAIATFGKEFWADPVRHKSWRLRLKLARREVVTGALGKLAETGRAVSMDIAERLADRFTAYREEQVRLFPDAHAVIDELRKRGLRLALVTNGASDTQWAKILRFDLAHRFDHLQIEGAVGFGKPEERAYRHAMAALDVSPAETWMVGDNLEWEVTAPQALGIHAVWHDVMGQGLPAGSPVRPDLIIRSLSELLPHLAG